jgi:predicted nucleic acid-binding protein
VTARLADLRLSDLTGPVVVDASVAVEYLIAISLSAPAQALFRATVDRDVELWAPDLLYPECVSAMRRLYRLRAITRTAAETAVGRLVQLPLTISGTRDFTARAWQLRDTVTPYDACYAALAETLEAPFITADRRFARSLAPQGARAVFLGDLS